MTVLLAEGFGTRRAYKVVESLTYILIGEEGGGEPGFSETC